MFERSHLQLLIYSGAKEIIEVDAGVANILTTPPSYSDTLEEIFKDTIFNSISSLNYNALTDDQKRAHAFSQIADYAKTQGITAGTSMINLAIEMAVQAIKGNS